jgi:hypothetical protein
MSGRAVQLTRSLAPSDRSALGSQRTALTALIASLLVLLVWLQRSGLQNSSFTTGYALFAAIIALVAFHWRKQAPSLPLGKVSVWLRYHVYLGYLTIVLFGLHVGFRLPSGIFESALFGVFLFVASSGLYGLYLSRTAPRQLRLLPEEVVYELIPQARREVQQETRRIISTATDSTALADFYKVKLAPFIEQRRGLLYFLYPNSRRRRKLTSDLRELHRYLNESQRQAALALERLLGRKDDLDFQAALQIRLKLWMYGHIGFSYSLLLLGAVHGLVAHAFQGGLR